MRINVIIAAAFMTSLASVVAVAQQQGDETLVLRAAAHSMRDRLPRGSITLDPRVVEDTGTHGAEVVSGLQRVLGGRVAAATEIISCASDRPRTCRLREGVAVVAFGAPSVRGDTASVDAFSTYVTDIERIPLAYESVRMTLTRRNGPWRVTKVLVLQRS